MVEALITTHGGSVDPVAVAKLGTTLTGGLLRPEQPGYDEARAVWNAHVGIRPGAIARCEVPGDVAACVRFAREHDVPLSVKGGGHGIAGACLVEGGLTVDLSAMQATSVDVESRRVTAQAGLKLGGFDAATQAHGLATTMGIATDTGVSGLTLGGGYGWLAGVHGMTCDNLLAAELVTAEGEIVTVDENSEPDLFWAIRGGGGNFGIVTSFTYRLHPVTTVLGGMIVYPRTAEVIAAFDAFARGAPDELSTVGLVATAPDGSPAFAIVCCWSGSIDEGARALEPMRRFATPIVDMIEPRPYLEQQMITDEAWPPGRLYYWKSSLVREVGPSMIDALLAAGETMPKPFSVIYLQQLHGAACRVDPTATAFPHRFDHFNCGAMLETEDPGEVPGGIEWSRKTWESIQPFVERSNYSNDLGEGEEDRVTESFGPNLERLVALKRRYDPTNLFNRNTNVRP